MIINSDWHKYYENVLEIGGKLEEIAKNLSFDVEITPGYGGYLSISLRNASIQEFADKVKEISKIYGTPHEIKESPVSDNRAPDLYARWKASIDNFEYNVELTSKEPDCPYDPLSEYEPSYYRRGKSRRLHAVCRNVLKELEDIDESAIKNA